MFTVTVNYTIMDNRFIEVLQMIKQSQAKAFKVVNAELINLYWNVGRYIKPRLTQANWGEKAIGELAAFIQQKHPELKGFSRSGLYRMIQFFETYSEQNFVAPAVRQTEEEKDQPGGIVAPLARRFQLQDITGTILAQLSWTNHLIIFSRCKSPQEREFYIRKSITERYGKRELNRQISASLYERSMNGKIQSSGTIPPEITSAFKDRYVFEFLNLPEPFSESDLQKSLITQMKNFILELGKDFLFIEQEYRLQVGNSDFYIDLLFFHRGLQALVAFELKADKFRPEHIGQLNFYLEALDRDVKKAHENPSIGILLCSDRDKEVVEYALSRTLSPTMVAEYKTQLPDKKLLQQKFHQIFQNTDTHWT